MGIVIWLLVGAVAGWLAGMIVKGYGFGLVDGVEDFNWVRYTYPFNMTRSPAGSVCVGRSATGVPIGLQLIGPQHGDQVVLRAMAALEQAIGFDELAPLA